MITMNTLTTLQILPLLHPQMYPTPITDHLSFLSSLTMKTFGQNLKQRTLMKMNSTMVGLRIILRLMLPSAGPSHMAI